jgi:16S rRNA (cytosine967-C5)-methyltransferase
VSVQDSAAQLAAVLLAAQRGQRVLDACAAPGGKTAHILQREPGVSLLAVDADAERLSMVTSTLARIGLRADCRVSDLTQPEAVADLPPFDRILLDAPCSATGVIRRHPDIKLLRREADIAGFARVQRQILRNVFARLAPGGRLVYATCSVLPEENEAVVVDFLANEPAARSLPWPSEVPLPPGAVRLEAGIQLLQRPQAGSDGFYYACLGRGSGE